jgi:hypothetical protein
MNRTHARLQRRVRERQDAMRKVAEVGAQKANDEERERKPYDPSKDMIKMAGWEFDCVGNNEALRYYMDILHRNGTILQASRGFIFRNFFVIEPRFLGPKCYEDYGGKKRRYVPCMMVFSIYHTLLSCQFEALKSVFERAKKEFTTVKKAEAVEYFEKVTSASITAFDMEIQKINRKCYDASEFVEVAANALKKEGPLSNPNYGQYVDLKSKVVMLEIFQNALKSWLNTFELQRVKNASILSLVASLYKKEDDAVKLDLLQHTTMTYMTEQVGGVIYNKYECLPEHHFTDYVEITMTRSEVDQASLDIAKEYAVAEKEMEEALKSRNISPVQGPPLPSVGKAEGVEFPSIDLARYDKTNQRVSESAPMDQATEPSSLSSEQ